MSLESSTTPAVRTGVAGQVLNVFVWLENLRMDAVLILMRIVIGAVFFMSAQTKVDGFALKESTFFLFEYEYALPLVPPVLAAYLATIAEHLFPLMLWLGLGSRLAALGLAGMTLTIQLFVYPEAWVTHGLWLSSLLVLVLQGPGRLSLDHLIRSRIA
ncbi:DoxX family protein [Cobetia marina]|jgi:putative oxidoreductase|uniref:DoxX family protein n=1 Tax=Cobetia marina TaxID=28258 RepID=A0ABU9GFY1_COBMA|nr:MULTISPECIES: DoxX family protein [Cobetia]AOM02484.1 DoxX family protein [Cobetia marina]AZV32290.1 DoxX family protein [Cobetia sp. ICG0124]MDA5562872.1 DoxX family protein [Cobetia sp. MMG027]MDH2291948.1 DoxX family protein [Cobetia sp. 10Alg 146]MDH2373447.1 DoxX family protein [Cobetia sp. 3AK]